MTGSRLHRTKVTRHLGLMRFTIPGWLHCTLGVLLVAIGTTDLLWTVVKYNDSCSFEKTDELDPCAANHIYTYLSSPIWSGLLTLGVGVLGLKLPSYGFYRNEHKFTAYLWCCLAIALVFMPAVIVLQMFELFKGEGYMYVMKDGQPVTDDTNKYAFIILLLTMAFAEAVIAFVSAMICLCFKPDHEQRILRWNADAESSVGPSPSRIAAATLPPPSQLPRRYGPVVPAIYPVLTPAKVWHPHARNWNTDLHRPFGNIASVYTAPRDSQRQATRPLEEPNVSW